MKKYSIIFTILLIVGSLSSFIVYSFVKSSPPLQAVKTPLLAESPARVYGTVEPAGREVFVSPPVTKEVMQVYVKEGDRVIKGQKLCSLDNDVELSQLRLAEAKVEAAKRALAISRDEMKRKKNLFDKNVDSEFVYTQSRLRVELDFSNLRVARKEAELAKSRLEQLELKSPIDGIVYKFDVRLGETLSSGDNSRIIIGSPDLWVRFYVESFWLGRISLGTSYNIFHSETGEHLGSGEVIYKAPYVGRRDFRTEDTQERFDTKFQEVVLSLKREKDNIPIGLSVVAELSEN
jgi:multidrug efflux pump subunit AcrA (membrane-fusion protein)